MFLCVCVLFECRIKIARLDNMFLTRMSWETVGGLSGQTGTLFCCIWSFFCISNATFMAAYEADWKRFCLICNRSQSMFPHMIRDVFALFTVWRVRSVFCVCRDDPDPQRHWSPSVCPVRTPAAGTVCQHHTRACYADLCVFLTTKQSKSLECFVNFLVVFNWILFCCFRRNIYKPYECFQGSWKTLNLVKSTIILLYELHAVLLLFTKTKTKSIINHFC